MIINTELSHLYVRVRKNIQVFFAPRSNAYASSQEKTKPQGKFRSALSGQKSFKSYPNQAILFEDYYLLRFVRFLAVGDSLLFN